MYSERARYVCMYACMYVYVLCMCVYVCMYVSRGNVFPFKKSSFPFCLFANSASYTKFTKFT